MSGFSPVGLADLDESGIVAAVAHLVHDQKTGQRGQQRHLSVAAPVIVLRRPLAAIRVLQTQRAVVQELEGALLGRRPAGRGGPPPRAQRIGDAAGTGGRDRGTGPGDGGGDRVTGPGDGTG